MIMIKLVATCEAGMACKGAAGQGVAGPGVACMDIGVVSDGTARVGMASSRVVVTGTATPSIKVSLNENGFPVLPNDGPNDGELSFGPLESI